MKSAQATSDKARPVRGFFLIVGIAVFLTATNVAESLDLALLDNWHRLLAERYRPGPRWMFAGVTVQRFARD